MSQKILHVLLVVNSIHLDIPGRICLFGDKIDLLGKPVIAATIDKFMHFDIKKEEGNRVRFFSHDYPKEEELFDLKNKNHAFGHNCHLKYWHACLKSLETFIDDESISGFSAEVKADLPIGAGLSSSAAVSVGFLRGLNELFGLGLNTASIAEHAYIAEHDILGIMCGRMDQYSIAFGGVTFISTGETPTVDVIDVDCIPLVVGDSCEPREAKKVLNRVKREVERKNPTYLDAFNVINDIVVRGRENLENGCDLQFLGNLMTGHQEQENMLQAATEKLNLLCQISIENGAFGAKQMGAGGGGCMVACCPDEATQKQVARAINEAGGRAEILGIFKY